MFYPLYVHYDDGSAYGGTFPDLPGCFTAADDLNDLPRMAQEAVDAYMGGEQLEIPLPSSPVQWKGHAGYQDGFWLLVDIAVDTYQREMVA